MSNKAVGFIGLGTMGMPIARRLLHSGFNLCVFDIDSTRINQLLDEGAKACNSCKEVAEYSDTVLSIVPDAEQVEEVMLSPKGVIAGAGHSHILVEMSTIDPYTSRRVAERATQKGISFIDAPVCLTPRHAAEGKLLILVGGKLEILQRVKHLLEVLADSIVYCGPVGSAVTMKLINNTLVQEICMALNECLTLGVKANLDLNKMISVFKQTAASNKVMEEVYPSSLFIGNFELGFALDWAHKDVGHMLKVAASLNVPCPIAAITHQWQSIARSKGKGRMDHTALATVLEEMVGVSLRVEETKIELE